MIFFEALLSVTETAFDEELEEELDDELVSDPSEHDANDRSARHVRIAITIVRILFIGFPPKRKTVELTRKIKIAPSFFYSLNDTAINSICPFSTDEKNKKQQKKMFFPAVKNEFQYTLNIRSTLNKESTVHQFGELFRSMLCTFRKLGENLCLFL